MKVVINDCYGKFSISPEAALWMYERGYQEVIPIEKYWADLTKDDVLEYPKALAKWRGYQSGDRKSSSFFITVFTPDESAVIDTKPENRADPLLVQCVETLGQVASGEHAELKVVEIPDEIDYVIEEYDGLEHIAEKHRKWR